MTLDISALLHSNNTLVLDGGLATALEAQGHDLNHPLWSGLLLRSNPAAIQQVHKDFYLAGADVAITASYQASPLGLQKHLRLSASDAKDLIQSSVRLAIAAKDEVSKTSPERKLFVAGSVGPYGAYLANGAEYTGDYGSITSEELKHSHRERIAALLDAGVDILACETVPSLMEVKALCELLRSDFPAAKAWMSCTLRDVDHSSDGTNIEEMAAVINECEQVISVGYNCIPLGLASAALKHLKSFTSKPLVIYPNSGEQWDGERKVWYGGAEARDGLGKLAKEWEELGAQLIGGCCRMSADDISAISTSLR